MKKLLLLSLATSSALSAFSTSAAEEVAILKLKIGKEKSLKEVHIALAAESAPATVANFEKLARHGFYKGIAFHRVFPKTLVQTGDPVTRRNDRDHAGTGGPGYTLAPEIRLKNGAGSVAAARLPDKINPGRRSNGSQFFVNLKAAPQYDGQYTVFGQVTAGLETLQAISELPADTNDNPLDRVVIRAVKIVPTATAAAEVSSRKAAAASQPKPKRPWWKLF